MPWFQAGMFAVQAGIGIWQGSQQDKAGNDAADAQNEFNEKMYEYNLEERDRLYGYTMDQTNIARQNAENNIAFKEELLKDEWKFKESLGIRDYNNQVAAFNKSEEVFGKQLQYNYAAADLAYQDNELQLFERRVSAQFNLEKVESTLGRQLADATYKKRGIENQVEGKQKATAYSKTLQTMQLSSKEAETAANIQDSRLKGMVTEGRLMARGQSGNSVKRSMASIATQTGVMQARLVDGLVRAESQYKVGVMREAQDLANFEYDAKNSISQINTSTEYNKYDANHSRRSLDESVKSAERSYNSQNMKIANDMFGANLKADAQRRAMPQDRIETPKPLALPRPDIQDPYKPGDPPEPVKNAGPGNMNTLGALAGAANNLAGLNFSAMFNTP
jgi:hypothetical protein